MRMPTSCYYEYYYWYYYYYYHHYFLRSHLGSSVGTGSARLSLR